MSPNPLPACSPFRIPHFASALTIFAALLCAASPSRACSIFVAGGDWGEPPVHDSAGAPLAVGHKASLGTFADGFDLEANSSNLTAILANWREFASSATSPEGTFTIWAEAPDGVVGGFAFPGKQIYLLLTRTSSPGNEALPDGSNVRDYAIFTSNSTVNPWVFPNSAEAADADGSNLAQIGTGQIDYAIAGTIDPAAGILLAQYSSDPTDPTAPNAFQQWLAIAFPGQQVAPDDIVEPLGIPVLAAFALGTPAASDSPAPAPYTTINEGGRIGVEFTRRTASSSGFRTFAEASADLSDWSLPVAHEVTAATETTETVRAFPDYTQAPEGTDTSKAFFRIRVEPATQN